MMLLIQRLPDTNGVPNWALRATGRWRTSRMCYTWTSQPSGYGEEIDAQVQQVIRQLDLLDFNGNQAELPAGFEADAFEAGAWATASFCRFD
jgi:hypothetical protein